MRRRRRCTLGSRRCEVCAGRATCKPSASAVERRASSAEEALHRGLRRRLRSVAVAHSVMSKARQAQVSRIFAAALGDRQQVVDLQQMGRGATAPGERIPIAAASFVALPDMALDSRGNVAPWRGLVTAADSIAGRVRWSSVGRHRARVLPFGSGGFTLRRRSIAAAAPSRGRRRRGCTCPVRRPPRGFVYALSRPGRCPGRTCPVRRPPR